MLSITEINTLSDFLELRHNWNKVLTRSRENNIFLTWEYLSTYWKHFGNKAKLRIICVKYKDDIIAIAPLRQSFYGFVGSIGYKVIEPLGYRGLMPSGGDYTGLLLGKKEAECLKLFLKYLAEDDDWDFIYLYDVHENSRIPYLLQKYSHQPLRFEVEMGAVCPYLPLPNSIDALFKGFSKKFRNNLRRCMRNLEKDHGKVKVKRYDELYSIEEAMKTLFELHGKRWRSKGMSETLNAQLIRARIDFHIDLAKMLARNNWLSLNFLTVNDKPVAGLYGFEYNKIMFAAVIGFDPEYSRYSPGNLLLLKIIEKCIMERLREFDFMKGEELYKFEWTKKFRRNVNIRFVNKKYLSNLYNLAIKTFRKMRVDKILSFQ